MKTELRQITRIARKNALHIERNFNSDIIRFHEGDHEPRYMLINKDTGFIEPGSEAMLLSDLERMFTRR